MVRLAALGLFHEANTFADALVGHEEMLAAGVLMGADIAAVHEGGTSTMSGYLAMRQCAGVEVIPLVMTTLVPGGPIDREQFDLRTQEMVDALREQGPFDGVLLALHGAAVAGGVPDADGHVLQLVRATVGPDVPIGASLDLHANISPAMCAAADVINTYRTNPHVDARKVALEVGRLIVDASLAKIRPVIALQQVPVAANILCQNTDSYPMSHLMSARARTAKEPDVLCASIAEGYPYADVPEMGMSVVVVGEDERSASSRARELAAHVWALRHGLDAVAPSPREAIGLAHAAARGPVLLLDVGDNIGGGAPGDSDVLLRAAQETGFEDLLIILVAPEAATLCHQVSVGTHVTLSLGQGAARATVGIDTGEVLALHDGFFRSTEPVHAGMSVFSAGPTAAVRLDSGQTVVVTTRAVMPLSTNQIRVLGLHPSQYRAIVAKGVHSPLAGYGPYVESTINVDTPGITAADLNWFHYDNRRRPMFPFEPYAVYP